MEEIFTAEIGSWNVWKCFECKWERSSYLRLRVKRELGNTFFCCSHMENANEKYNVPGHTGTFFRPLKVEVPMDVPSKHAKFGGNATRPSQLKKNNSCSNEYSMIVLTATVAKEKIQPVICETLTCHNRYRWKIPQHIREWFINHLVAYQWKSKITTAYGGYIWVLKDQYK